MDSFHAGLALEIQEMDVIPLPLHPPAHILCAHERIIQPESITTGASEGAHCMRRQICSQLICSPKLTDSERWGLEPRLLHVYG
jgi:hypothetical protein